MANNVDALSAVLLTASALAPLQAVPQQAAQYPAAGAQRDTYYGPSERSPYSADPLAYSGAIPRFGADMVVARCSLPGSIAGSGSDSLHVSGKHPRSGLVGKSAPILEW